MCIGCIDETLTEKKKQRLYNCNNTPTFERNFSNELLQRDRHDKEGGRPVERSQGL
jgi:hypothetical protein